MVLHAITLVVSSCGWSQNIQKKARWVWKVQNNPDIYPPLPCSVRYMRMGEETQPGGVILLDPSIYMRNYEEDREDESKRVSPLEQYWTIPLTSCTFWAALHWYNVHIIGGVKYIEHVEYILPLHPHETWPVGGRTDGRGSRLPYLSWKLFESIGRAYRRTSIYICLHILLISTAFASPSLRKWLE